MIVFFRWLPGSAEINKPVSLILVFCIQLVIGLAPNLEPSVPASIALYSLLCYATLRVAILYPPLFACYSTPTAGALCDNWTTKLLRRIFSQNVQRIKQNQKVSFEVLRLICLSFIEIPLVRCNTVVIFKMLCFFGKSHTGPHSSFRYHLFCRFSLDLTFKAVLTWCRQPERCN